MAATCLESSLHPIRTRRLTDKTNECLTIL
jgi:hypothetical protein